MVTGTVGMSACWRPGIPASPATSARSAARLPGSGMRTVRIGTPFSDDTTCAFNCASRACIWATVAPGASSSSSCVRTYSTPFSSDTSSGVKLAASLITSVITDVAGGSGGPGGPPPGGPPPGGSPPTGGWFARQRLSARVSRASFAFCCLRNRARAFLARWVRKKRFFAAFIPRLNVLSRFSSLAQVAAATGSADGVAAPAGAATVTASAATAIRAGARFTW